MKPVKILTGMTFGRLTVQERAEDYYNHSCGTKTLQWSCICSCGEILVVRGHALKSGNTRSCGCLQKENLSISRKTHGRSRSSEYCIYDSMVSRCNNANNKHYKHYGGRGIKICPRWLEPDRRGFLNFLEDMGEKPSKEYSIERINVNGDYEPSNCKWVRSEVQARNKRKRIDNKSGVTGVRYSEGKDGSKRWSAYWRNSGKQCTKSFSLNIHGEELAFFMACEYREYQMMLLNLQGAGYSEGHGK